MTSYYLDADDRLIAISSKEQIDYHRTVIDYEEDVTYAFEWSLAEKALCFAYQLSSY
ncbi:MAG: hypothetical protein IJL60_09380 [Clostridiales bacterium]|nr:hypothetical protein [Clostridiales bacterium]